MKRCLAMALVFMGLVLFGTGGRGYAVQAVFGMEHSCNLMKRLKQRADTVYRYETDKKREWEAKGGAYIDGLLSKMSLEEKLSQMMVLTNPKDITEEQVARCQPGGIIYFSIDFNGKTVEQVAEKTRRLQDQANCPMFVGVDEEGGQVSRTSGMRGENIPRFQGARMLWKERNVETVKSDTKDKAEFLKQMGINLNFNPVADVANRKGAYMYDRCAGDDGSTVADYVEIVLGVMQEENMGNCMKHFPGYGNNANTHMVYTVDRRGISEYESSDFLPFEAGISKGADMIMMSHIVMAAVDDSNPASLSKDVHKLLREELGFQGIIITDDLNMQAILSRMTMEQASKQAILAGNDMIFSADYEASLRGMKQAVSEGMVAETQIDESVARILKMKIERNIITVP